MKEEHISLFTEMNSNTYWNTLSLLLLLLFVGSKCENEYLEVKTPYGTFRGQIKKTEDERDLLSFLGIPYAQPPVGALRFKDPVKLEEREDVFDANEEKVCIQPPFNFNLTNDELPKIIGTEDCLHLNIYRPKEIPMETLLPVYFWIHGGGFFLGSGNEMWSPHRLLEQNRDIVLVSINYRLGIFGFLSANDVNLPGNLGLKDQTMALKWVNENIKLFGGDPNSITIGGLSAGGASVSHHINSKASKGLFHRAISQSGTADCSWAKKTLKESREIASNIISFLGCPFEPNELLECLQQQPVDILIDSMDTIKVNRTGMIMYFVPVIEKDSPSAFMTSESVEMGSDVPWLTGVTNEEGLPFNQYITIDNDNYKDLLPIVAYYKKCNNAMTDELKQFYIGDKDFGPESINELVQLLSDRLFNHGLILSVRSHKGKTYMYQFSYVLNNTLPMKPDGLKSKVGHGEDMFYFMNRKNPWVIDLKDTDLELANTVLEMWYNFIKNGDPTPESHKWEESEGGVKYLDIGLDNITMSSNMFEKRMQFLDELMKKWPTHDEL